MPHSADQTFTSLPATGTDTCIPGIGLSYLSSSPPLSLHRLSRLSLLSLRLRFLVRSVMNRSRLTGRRPLRGVKNCRQITARRLLRGAKRCDMGQRTPRVQVDRGISLGLIKSVLRGNARWKGVLKGALRGGLARDVGNGARTHDKVYAGEFQCNRSLKSLQFLEFLRRFRKRPKVTEVISSYSCG